MTIILNLTVYLLLSFTFLYNCVWIVRPRWPKFFSLLVSSCASGLQQRATSQRRAVQDLAVARPFMRGYSMKWLGFGSKEPQQLPPLEKLKGFYDLAKDAIERAYQADMEGQPDRAIKLYSTGIQAIREAFKLPVQGSGLGPQADNIAGWKQDMAQWEGHVRDRIRHLESGNASPSCPSPTGSAPYKPQRSVPLGARPQPSQPQRAGSMGQRAIPQRQGAGGATAAATAASRRGTSGGGAAGAAGGAAGAPRSAAGAGAAAGRDDQKFRDMVLSEVLDKAPNVSWDDIADLKNAKQALVEAVVLPSLRADIFKGLRSPVRGILLYGPPGNGKTMLGKALAHEAKACFFAISASSLTSKWVGEGEKLVRALFQVAAEHAPSIIFFDEIDSILSARSANENDAMRRLKTEFLVQFDGVMGGDDRVVVVGATNRPQEIDDAVRRRLVKRIYIPLPDEEGRLSVLQHLLKGQPGLRAADLAKIVRATAGYSASDLTALCKEAAMGPIRELGPAIAKVQASSIRSICLADFAAALNVIKPSVNREALVLFEEFTREFGTQ